MNLGGSFCLDRIHILDMYQLALFWNPWSRSLLYYLKKEKLINTDRTLYSKAVWGVSIFQKTVCNLTYEWFWQIIFGKWDWNGSIRWWSSSTEKNLTCEESQWYDNITYALPSRLSHDFSILHPPLFHHQYFTRKNSHLLDMRDSTYLAQNKTPFRNCNQCFFAL